MPLAFASLFPPSAVQPLAAPPRATLMQAPYQLPVYQAFFHDEVQPREDYRETYPDS